MCYNGSYNSERMEPTMPRTTNPDRKSDKKFDAYKTEFTRQNYDTVSIYVAKGMRETIKAHAAERGESVNAFVNRAVAEQMKRDQAQGTPDA